MRVSVVVFPGTNCDRDTKWAFEQIGAEVEFVWHNETDLKNPDLVVLPGGFSEVNDVRVGKQIVIDIDTDDENQAKAKVEEMCEKLLANTVIENYEVEVKK
jgi:phosphoribosylformylglycinamidine synthase PurS subunit